VGNWFCCLWLFICRYKDPWRLCGFLANWIQKHVYCIYIQIKNYVEIYKVIELANNKIQWHFLTSKITVKWLFISPNKICTRSFDTPPGLTY
jgi:hypothetical protein